MVTGAPPHFKIEIEELMTELFLIGAGFAIYLILALFCLRFIFFDVDGSPKSRKILFVFIFLSISAVTVDLMCAYAGNTVVLICGLTTDTPIVACNDPALDRPAFSRDVSAGVAESIMFILADGMLYYRAMIIWQRNIWVVTLVGLMFLGVEAFLIYVEVTSFNITSLRVEGAMFWYSAFYDIFTSGLIIWKLISYRRNAKEAERSESIAIYTSLIAVFVEASLFLTLIRILNAALLVSGKTFLDLFWPNLLLDLAAAISPLFIILRLAVNSFNDPYKIRRRGGGGDPAKVGVGANKGEDIESNMVFAAGGVRSGNGMGTTRRSGRSNVFSTLILGTRRSENVRSEREGAGMTMSIPRMIDESPMESTAPPRKGGDEKLGEDGRSSSIDGGEHRVRIPELK